MWRKGGGGPRARVSGGGSCWEGTGDSEFTARTRSTRERTRLFPHSPLKDASPRRPEELASGRFSFWPIVLAILGLFSRLGVMRFVYLEVRLPAHSQVRSPLLELLLAEPFELHQFLNSGKWLFLTMGNDLIHSRFLHARQHLQLLRSCVVQIHHPAHAGGGFLGSLCGARQQKQAQAQSSQRQCS